MRSRELFMLLRIKVKGSDFLSDGLFRFVD